MQSLRTDSAGSFWDKIYILAITLCPYLSNGLTSVGGAAGAKREGAKRNGARREGAKSICDLCFPSVFPFLSISMVDSFAEMVQNHCIEIRGDMGAFLADVVACHVESRVGVVQWKMS